MLSKLPFVFWSASVSLEGMSPWVHQSYKTQHHETKLHPPKKAKFILLVSTSFSSFKIQSLVFSEHISYSINHKRNSLPLTKNSSRQVFDILVLQEVSQLYGAVSLVNFYLFSVSSIFLSTMQNIQVGSPPYRISQNRFKHVMMICWCGKFHNYTSIFQNKSSLIMHPGLPA